MSLPLLLLGPGEEDVGTVDSRVIKKRMGMDMDGNPSEAMYVWDRDASACFGFGLISYLSIHPS